MTAPLRCHDFPHGDFGGKERASRRTGPVVGRPGRRSSDRSMDQLRRWSGGHHHAVRGRTGMVLLPSPRDVWRTCARTSGRLPQQRLGTTAGLPHSPAPVAETQDADLATTGARVLLRSVLGRQGGDRHAGPAWAVSSRAWPLWSLASSSNDGTRSRTPSSVTVPVTVRESSGRGRRATGRCWTSAGRARRGRLERVRAVVTSGLVLAVRRWPPEARGANVARSRRRYGSITAGLVAAAPVRRPPVAVVAGCRPRRTSVHSPRDRRSATSSLSS